MRSRHRLGICCGHFEQILAEAGFVEGRNVAIEYRFAEGHIRSSAGAGCRSGATPSGRDRRDHRTPALAAKAATATIPIVFNVADDPVELGLVASLARPGGNATGVSFLFSDLVAKHLGLLRELLPKAARFGLLVNPRMRMPRT